MELARSVIENARIKVAMLMAAGAFVLGVAGCNSPEEPPKQPPAATAEAHFPVNTQADTLPAAETVQGKNNDNTRISNRSIAFDIEKEEQKRINEKGMAKYLNAKQVYTNLLNIDPETKEQRDKMPSRASAPAIDFMLNGKGKLVYEDKTPGEGLSEEERRIIKAANNVKQILEPAMRADDVNTLHIRVFRPDANGTDYRYPQKSSAQYISKDFNDGGKKSIYYFMRAEDMEYATNMEQVFAHEFGHAMLGQREYDGSNYDRADREVLVKACTVIRDSAMQTIAAKNYSIIGDLRVMQSMVQKKYKPMYGNIIKALQEGTYDKLSNSGDMHGMPECYLQNPWSAFITQATAQKDFNIDAHLAKGVDLGVYEEYVQRMIDNYNDIIQENEIYKVLNDSLYMKGYDAEEWGHTNEGVDELTASPAGLVMRLPSTFGEHVSKLKGDQKKAVLSLVERNVQKLMLGHMKDSQYQKFVGDQHAIFLASAGVAR